MAKAVDDKAGKVQKLQKQMDVNKPVDLESNEKKSSKLEKKMEEASAAHKDSSDKWKAESVGLLEKIEVIDRKRIEFLRQAFQKSVEYQLDNLRLQMMVNSHTNCGLLLRCF